MAKVFWGVLGALFTFFVLLPVGCTVLVGNTASNLANTFDAVSKQTVANAQQTKTSCVSGTSCSATDREQSAQLAGNAWLYTDSTDDMRGTKTHGAGLLSQNELQFDFPYSGGSRGTLALRRRAGKEDVMLMIEKGQFTCNSFRDDTVAVKFDDGPVQRFSCATPSDGTANVIFLQGARRFISGVRHSRRAIIEAEFFQEGDKQLAFNTSGLKW